MHVQDFECLYVVDWFPTPGFVDFVKMTGINGCLNHKALVEYPTSEEVLKNVTSHMVDYIETVSDDVNFFMGGKRVCVNNPGKFVPISVLVLKNCTDLAAFKIGLKHCEMKTEKRTLLRY